MATRKLNDFLLSSLGTESTCPMDCELRGAGKIKFLNNSKRTVFNH